MITVTLSDVARITGGRLGQHAPADLPITGPAYLDSRAAAPGGLFVAFKGATRDGHDFAADAHAVLGSRDTQRPTVVVNDQTVALARLARHVVRSVDPHVFAITGSHGKTTTKDLLAHVLGADVATRGNLNNELGVPLTCLELEADSRTLVLEMGARGLGQIAWLCDIARPGVAAVLAVGTAHVGEFGSVELIAQAKSEIIQALGPEGTAVLNAEDPAVVAMAGRTCASVLWFGAGGDVFATDVVVGADGRATFTLNYQDARATVRLPLVGEHNVTNACAAAAMAIAAGMDVHNIAHRLASAPGAAHRMNTVTTAAGTLLLDDSYNANPDSMQASLRTLAHVGQQRGGRTWAVLGRMHELGEQSALAHGAVGALARELTIDRLIVVGDAPTMATAFGPDASVVADAMDVAPLLAHVGADDTILVKGSRAGALDRLVQVLAA